MSTTITVSDELARRIRDLVADGRYPDAASAVEAAIDLLPMESAERDAHLTSIRHRVEAAIADPRRHTPQDVRRHLEARAAELVRNAASKRPA